MEVLVPPLRNPAASGSVMGHTLPRSYPTAKTWDFVFLNSDRVQIFPCGVQGGLGLPGVGNSPIRNTRLAAGSVEVKGGLSVHHSESGTSL